MSEIQNRTIKLLQLEQASRDGRQPDFRLQMLEASLALYRDLGGAEDAGYKLLHKAFEREPEDVPTSVGNLMIALAALSQQQDMDMMQAAYNVLRARLRQLAPQPCAAE
nr:hypothetical protein REQ54_00595 [Rhizobium sp. Q54]